MKIKRKSIYQVVQTHYIISYIISYFVNDFGLKMMWRTNGLMD